MKFITKELVPVTPVRSQSVYFIMTNMRISRFLCTFAVGKMGRLLAIDYGRKRCGLAVTDVLQI